jgi:hypothetical protein
MVSASSWPFPRTGIHSGQTGRASQAAQRPEISDRIRQGVRRKCIPQKRKHRERHFRQKLRNHIKHCIHTQDYSHKNRRYLNNTKRIRFFGRRHGSQRRQHRHKESFRNHDCQQDSSDHYALNRQHSFKPQEAGRDSSQGNRIRQQSVIRSFHCFQTVIIRQQSELQKRFGCRQQKFKLRQHSFIKLQKQFFVKL